MLKACLQLLLIAATFTLAIAQSKEATQLVVAYRQVNAQQVKAWKNQG